MDRGDRFLRVTWATAHALSAMSKRMERELGVTAPQRLVLRVVASQPGITAGRLAAAVGLHPSTVTGIVRRLEQRGHLARSGDPDDRRMARLRITASGAALDQLERGTVESVVREVLADRPADEVASATGLLGTLATALDTAARVKGDRR